MNKRILIRLIVLFTIGWWLGSIVSCARPSVTFSEAPVSVIVETPIVTPEPTPVTPVQPTCEIDTSNCTCHGNHCTCFTEVKHEQR